MVFSSAGIKQCAKFGADPISHESGRGLNNNGLEENWPTRKRIKQRKTAGNRVKGRKEGVKNHNYDFQKFCPSIRYLCSTTLLEKQFKFPRYNMKCRGKPDTT